jgi:opacity protein-like surface antigen
MHVSSKTKGRAVLIACAAIAAAFVAMFVTIAWSAGPAHAEGILSRTASTASQTPAAPEPVAPATWTGFYVGGHAGYGIGVNELSWAHGGESIRGLSDDGFVGGVHAGVDWQVPNTIWVLGARGGYTWSGMEFSAGPFNVSVTDSWWVDGVVGLGLGQVKPYVFAGYTQAKTDVSVSGVDSPDLRGWRAGTGIEWKVPGAPFMTVGLDYAYTNYDRVGVECLNIEPEDHRVLFTVNYRFGGPK